MGVENNEAILATTWSQGRIDDFHKWLETDILPKWRGLFVVVDGLINGKSTIIMAPDGGKKYWDTAEEGKAVRDQFVRFLKSFDYEDGSNPFDWVEVGYGTFGQTILRGNCINCYDDEEYAYEKARGDR